MCSAVTSNDIANAVRALGVEAGDILLVHSSLRSLGKIDGGVQAVIDGIESVLGKEGTLVMPTLSQVDFFNSYKTWYMDKPSDVGYLTEYFRKLPYVYRSNQETHSVAARGKLAYELTYEHKGFGPHMCPFGEYAFADSSPWRKMYDRGAKVMFLGINMGTLTFKHMLEAELMEYYLGLVKDEKKRAELFDRTMKFGSFSNGVWLFYNCVAMQTELEALGLVSSAVCGDATLICVEIQKIYRATYDILKSAPEKWFKDKALEWINDCIEASK